MGARKKINHAFFNGCIFFAALLGLAFQSWVMFFCSLAVLVCLSIYEGSIRLRK
jgi:hypothetical protein